MSTRQRRINELFKQYRKNLKREAIQSLVAKSRNVDGRQYVN